MGGQTVSAEHTPIDTLAALVDRAREEYQRADLAALVQTFTALTVTANNCEVRARLRLREQVEASRNTPVVSKTADENMTESEASP